MFAFGDGTKGQLGLGPDMQKCERPRPVKFFDRMRVAFVAAGEWYNFISFLLICLNLFFFVKKIVAFPKSHTAFVIESGKIYSCGDNRYGKLGLNQKKYNSIQFIPKPIKKYRGLNVLNVIPQISII